ncbi:MAG: hypothetical protein ACD_5C00188G0002 [uncultured bacterium]|nr:MAG: hypothetical protein ACD_5C00188G0002 [uncultured bacterium]
MLPPDIKKVAWLHSDCLPTSLLTLLGMSVLHEFYRFVASSKLEELFVVKQPDVLGAAVLSLRPDDLDKRFALNSWIVFFPALLLGICSKPFFWKSIKNFICGSSKEIAQHEEVELVILFVDKSIRKQGIASKLLDDAEKFLLDKGIRSYYVKTVANHDDPQAVSFYQRKGFLKYREGVAFGKKYFYLRKQLG